MAPVKVYGWAISPFVSRALLALEEAGVDYELVPMSRAAGDHRRPEHLARNPFGKVPVLEDGDLTLFESRAIARHVFRKHKPELLGGGSLERSAMVDVWLEVEAHQLQPAAGAVVVECVFAPLLGRARNQAAVDESLGKLGKVLEVYEARLSRSRYLAGDFLSAADLSHFTVMHYFMGTEHAAVVEALPHVRAWWGELAARPAARKVAELMPLDLGCPREMHEQLSTAVMNSVVRSSLGLSAINQQCFFLSKKPAPATNQSAVFFSLCKNQHQPTEQDS